MKNKKLSAPVIAGVVCAVILVIAAGYFLIHNYSEPTCTEPAVCSICGKEGAAALGHSWVDATCTEPKTCTVCGATEGEALGHDFAPATREVPKTCRTCGLTEGEPSKVQVGDYITFGHYEQDNDLTNGQETIEWLVLDVQDNQALVISRYGLDAQSYNTKSTDVTWETCSLRTWLNNDFLNAAFSAEEQEAILLTTVDNSESQRFDYSTVYFYAEKVTGGKNTQDKVFLLSYAEANKYLGVTWGNYSNMESRTSPTAYALANRAYTKDNYKTSDGAAAGNWWLRSTGNSQDCAEYVEADGALNDSGSVYIGIIMVRPALVINLDSGLF